MIKFHVVKSEFRKHPDVKIKLPVRATAASSGYDFYSPIDYIIPVGNAVVKIWTDIKIELPKEYELVLAPRSSCGTIVLANTIGKVDADYFSNVKNDGNIGIFLRNYGSEPVVINAGDRIIQGSIYQYFITDDDAPLSQIRVGGCGSSGTN